MPFAHKHTNPCVMISQFQINGTYLLQYFNLGQTQYQGNYYLLLNDIIEFVGHLKSDWSDYDWIWYESWEGYNLNSKDRRILDIFNKAFIHHNILPNKLWFYIGNYLQSPLYGFNYINVFPTGQNLIPEFIHTTIDRKIENKIYIQGGRTTETRTELYNRLLENNLLNSEGVTHTLTLNDYTNGGGKKIPMEELYKTIDSTFLYVINETDYNMGLMHNRDFMHFTEKTIIPINQYKPFVMLGGPHYLKYLKKIGFKTFDSIWDESYDDIIDNNLRMNAVIDIIKNINNKTIMELEFIKEDIKSILLYNKDQYNRLRETPLIPLIYD